MTKAKKLFYDMLTSCYLNSTARSVHMRTRITPENEAEAAELKELAEKGVCKLFVAPVKKEEGEEDEAAEGNEEGGETEVNTEDDISEVPGIGAPTLAKLTAAGITTRSALKDAALNKNAELAETLSPAQASKFKTFFDDEEAEAAAENAEEGTPASSREENEDEEEEGEPEAETTEAAE